MEHNERERYGRYIEDYAVGDVFKHWPGRTITESDHQTFCLLTGNLSPLHMDAHEALNHRHKQRLVPGLLILALAVSMGINEISGQAIAALGYEEVRHLAPTFIGDTIYARTTVTEKSMSARGGRGTVKLETVAYNQKGEDILSCVRTLMIPTKPAPVK